MSLLKTLNHLYSNSLMEFLKNPSLVFYSSSYIPLSVLSYLIQQQTITSMQMILNLSYTSQLWIKFDFSHNITQLENTITNVAASNWVSSKFLSLNPSKSKTEFLIFCLPQQLSNIRVCIHLGYLRTDISGFDQASLFHLTHFAMTHRHLIHYNF